MSLNLAIVVGRCGKDAERKQTRGDNAPVVVSVATDFWKAKGDKLTDWHRMMEDTQEIMTEVGLTINSVMFDREQKY